MYRAVLLTGVFAVSALAVGVGRDVAWEWHGSVARGKLIDIRGFTGDIHALPSSDGTVSVVAQIDPDSTPGEVQIRALPGMEGLVVCAVRSGGDECSADSNAAPGTRVDYVVRVPSGVHLAARTVNGNIEANALSGDVSADTVNGGVVVSTSGTAEIHTVNGSIDASLTKPFWDRSPEFSAVNGKISVRIPKSVRSGLRAETRNGTIVNDVPRFRGTATDQIVDGQIGAGGCGSMSVRTINGAIELHGRF